MMELNRIESAVLTLLQSAIWEKQTNSRTFKGLTAEEWEELIQLSVTQGVQAIVFDGVLKLPSHLQPPRPLKLKWIINVDATEKRFDRYLNTCADLIKLYADNRIKTMVLKGIGLAHLYPVPKHREFGDIDIYLFGNYKRGNELIKKEGIKLEHADKKHLMFYYKGIPVENHRKFSNTHRYKVDAQLETALNEIMIINACNMVALPKKVTMFTPPPMFNAIFLARHMIVHFASGISIRHLCDWTMFLFKNHGNYSVNYLINEFRHTDQLEMITILSDICVKYLGLPKSYNPFQAIEAIETLELEKRIFEDVLRGDSTLTTSSNPFKIVLSKWNRFHRSLWKHQLAHRVSKRHLIWESVIEHLITPSTIFRT